MKRKRDSKIAYHGYIPMMVEFLTKRNNPKVLEIGVDRGVTMLPLVTAMAGYCKSSFMYMGCDVNVQEALKLTVQYMPQPIPNSCYLMEKNSLEFLPELVEQGIQFDLVLLDGDHNYYTVSNELPHMDKLLLNDGLLLVDDYNGKWSERDMWYSERPGYEKNVVATAPVETKKSGVKLAVDEWLNVVRWQASQPIQGEPLLIHR